VIFLKENLLKDGVCIFHSKLYYIDYYLKNIILNNDTVTFFNLSEKEKEIDNLLDKNKIIYILYPFGLDKNDADALFHKFKIISVNNEIYKMRNRHNYLASNHFLGMFYSIFCNFFTGYYFCYFFYMFILI
jgi:hypothetical protein